MSAKADMTDAGFRIKMAINMQKQWINILNLISLPICSGAKHGLALTQVWEPVTYDGRNKNSDLPLLLNTGKQKCSIPPRFSFKGMDFLPKTIYDNHKS